MSYKILGFSEINSFAEFIDSLVNNILRSDGILLRKDYGVYLPQYIFEGQKISWTAIASNIQSKINSLTKGIRCESYAVDVNEEESKVIITLKLTVRTSAYSAFEDATADFIFPIEISV